MNENLPYFNELELKNVHLAKQLANKQQRLDIREKDGYTKKIQKLQEDARLLKVEHERATVSIFKENQQLKERLGVL